MLAQKNPSINYFQGSTGRKTSFGGTIGEPIAGNLPKAALAASPGPLTISIPPSLHAAFAKRASVRTGASTSISNRWNSTWRAVSAVSPGSCATPTKTPRHCRYVWIAIFTAFHCYGGLPSISHRLPTPPGSTSELAPKPLHVPHESRSARPSANRFSTSTSHPGQLQAQRQPSLCQRRRAFAIETPRPCAKWRSEA